MTLEQEIMERLLSEYGHHFRTRDVVAWVIELVEREKAKVHVAKASVVKRG